MSERERIKLRVRESFGRRMHLINEKIDKLDLPQLHTLNESIKDAEISGIRGYQRNCYHTTVSNSMRRNIIRNVYSRPSDSHSSLEPDRNVKNERFLHHQNQEDDVMMLIGESKERDDEY